MSTTITINGITGTSPYNITLCDTDPINQTCVWISQITDLDLPYTFTPPVTLQYTTNFIVKIVDSGPGTCTIVTPPTLRTLNPCNPIYIDATNNQVYSFDPATYDTTLYFDPGVTIDAMTKSDDKIWICDNNAGFIYEYDSTASTNPSLIRQIDTLTNGINDIYGMCVFSSSTTLLTLNYTGLTSTFDINVIDISSNVATKSFLYSVVGTPNNDCNLLRDDNIGITYMKTSSVGLKAFYDDGTQYSSGSWPAGSLKGFFRDSSTAEIFGVGDTGSVYKIQQPPGLMSPFSITAITPDNLVSGGLGQSNTCIPPVISGRIYLESLTGQTITLSSSTFSWIDWGDSDKISGSTGYYTKSHTYTPSFTGYVSINTYQTIYSFSTTNKSPLTGSTIVYTSEISGLTGLIRYTVDTNTKTIGAISNLPSTIQILGSQNANLSGTTNDFPPDLLWTAIVNDISNISGDVSNLPSNLEVMSIRGTQNLAGSTSGFPSNMVWIDLHGSSTISGSTSGLPSNLQYISLNDLNVLSGTTSGLPSTLSYIYIRGNNTIGGDTSGLPRVEFAYVPENFNAGLSPEIYISGYNTISGDTSGLPPKASSLTITGYNTISGDTSGLPISAYTYITGYNTISGDISGLPSASTFVWIFGNNTISGDTSGLPSSIRNLNIAQGNPVSVLITTGNTISGNISGFTGSSLSSIGIAGANTISGDTTDIPTTASLNTISLYGFNTLSGDIANIPPNIDLFRVYGNNTLSGDISGLPTSTLTTFEVAGNNTISGGFSGFPTSPGLTYFTLVGGNIDTTVGSASGMQLPNGISQFTYTPSGSAGTALSSTDVDSIIFAATGTTWVGTSRVLSIRGGNSAPTVASLPARQLLSGGSFNVTVLTN